MDKFHLSEKFIEGFKTKRPPFGFNGLGELVYMRTYSRIKEDGANEQWYETCRRVVDGTYNMQRKWIDEHGLGWNSWQAQKSAQEMYERMFQMKFLPPGRGLWAMGSPITEERGLYAALNNCAFVSTKTLKEDGAKPFTFLMDASMLGVGVGFDTVGAGQIIVKSPNPKRDTETYKIPDTREGWVESLRLLIESYFYSSAPIQFDYSLIRAAGAPIKGFGGISAGCKPLSDMHDAVRRTLDREVGSPISITAIVDIMNHVGKAVVAGNVRRTAEIVFGDMNSKEYLDLKNYEVNPQREEYGWTSNNSIFAKVGMSYDSACERTVFNGEPGFAWLENMRGYSRMNNGPDNKDARADGGNPCLEQTLESYELCCLVETFPFNHKDLDDYRRTLKFAYLYAKTVTLGKTHWPETNRVMLRNRRIGCSVSGVAQFLHREGIDVLKTWLTEGYDTIQQWDKVYSDWMAIPRSIKTTSVKPSGTVSLLAGATPGLHYPESRFYIRRFRLSKFSDMVKPLEKAGYIVEPCYGSEETTVVVEVPVDIGEGIRCVSEVSMWEQFALAAFMQKYWADNQVSATISFDPVTEGPQLARALDIYQYQLKGISCLPRHQEGAFRQMPYEKINEQTYIAKFNKIRKLNMTNVKGEEADVEKFCNNDVCEFPLPTT